MMLGEQATFAGEVNFLLTPTGRTNAPTKVNLNDSLEKCFERNDRPNERPNERICFFHAPVDFMSHGHHLDPGRRGLDLLVTSRVV